MTLFIRWRANFLRPGRTAAGGSHLGAGEMVFGTIASITDLLLFFLPTTLTHADHGSGAMYWYWSLAAFALAVLLVSLAGLMARYYIGRA